MVEGVEMSDLGDAVYDFETELNDMGFWEWFVPNAPKSIAFKFTKYLDFVLAEARNEDE